VESEAMSIEMTQKLVFETDDIKLFEKMLDVSVRIVFKKTHNLKFLLQEPSCFDDGKYDESYDSEQVDIVESADYDNWYFLEPIGTYHGAVFFKQGKGFDNKDKAAKASCESRIEPKPKYMWLSTIYDHDYEGSTRNRPKYRYSAKNHDDFMDNIMKQIKLGDQRKFHEDFSHLDTEDDVSFSAGYRLEHRPSGGADMLDISFCGIYYGK
jgi:hypothetical protein